MYQKKKEKERNGFSIGEYVEIINVDDLTCGRTFRILEVNTDSVFASSIEGRVAYTFRYDDIKKSNYERPTLDLNKKKRGMFVRR